MNNIKYHLLLLCSTIIVAGSFISAQIASSSIDPFSLSLARFSLATIILAPFVFLKRKRWHLFAKAFPKGAVISLFYSAFFVIMFTALKTTTTLNTGTLYTLVPFITALASIFLFKEVIRPGILLVYIISTIGTLWVISRGDISVLLNFDFNHGDALFLFGCLSMVGFSVSMKLIYKGEEMLVFVFSTLFSGAIWMAGFMLLSGQKPDYSGMTFSISLHVVYLTLFATLLTSWIMQIATVKLSPKQVSSYIYLNPVFVALISMCSTGDAMPIGIYPGIALSIGATILLQVLATREKNQKKNIS